MACHWNILRVNQEQFAHDQSMAVLAELWCADDGEYRV
jgi:hypothetical protein